MDPAASVPELTASLHRRISAFQQGDADPVLERAAIMESSALMARASGPDGEIPIAVAVAVAWLRWCRFQALPENDDQVDLEASLKIFGQLAKIDLTLVPEELQPNWPGARIAPASEQAVQAAAGLLREAFDDDDAGKLDEAIEALRELAQSVPADDTNRRGVLGNLSVALRARWRAQAELSDLDEAVESARQATLLAGTENSHAMNYLQDLINVLDARYAETETDSDLNEIIQVGRRIMATMGDDEKLGASLQAFAIALLARANQTGSFDDTDELVDVRRRIVEIAPFDDQSRPAKLSELGNAFKARYGLAHRDSDLEMAVEVGRLAALMTPPDDPHRDAILWNLSNALYAMWQHSGKEKILAETIKRRRVVVDATDRESPYRASRLLGLSEVLLRHFERTRSESDGDEAVQFARQGISFTGPWEPARRTGLSQLRSSLQTRLEHAGSPADKEELVALDRFASGNAVMLGESAVSGRTPAEPPDLVAPGSVTRGIVIGGRSSYTADGGFSLSGTNPSARAAALYWDKLVWVYGNGMGQHGMGQEHEDGLRITVGLEPDVRELRELGHIQFVRRDVYHPCWDPHGPSVDHGHILGMSAQEFVSLEDIRIDRTAAEFNRGQPGETWSAGHLVSPVRATFLDASAESASALLLTMALPVPPLDLAVSAVLEFRQHNRELLVAFHDQIADLARSTADDVGDRLRDLRDSLAEIDARLARESTEQWTRITRVVLGGNGGTRSSELAGFLGGQTPYTPYAESLPAPTPGSMPLLTVVTVSPRMIAPGKMPDFHYLFDKEHSVALGRP